MQADFQNIFIFFIGLSLFSGVANFFKKATHRVRMVLWKYIISLLRRTVCCKKQAVSFLSYNKSAKIRLLVTWLFIV